MRTMRYSPTLLDECLHDPELAARVFNSIPKIEEHPRKDTPVLGDLARFGEVVRVFNGVTWEGL